MTEDAIRPNQTEGIVLRSLSGRRERKEEHDKDKDRVRTFRLKDEHCYFSDHVWIASQSDSLSRDHPPTQETTPACRNVWRRRQLSIALRRAGTALAVEECVTQNIVLQGSHNPCFGGFCYWADDPPKPWRRRASLLEITGLPVGLHVLLKCM